MTKINILRKSMQSEGKQYFFQQENNEVQINFLRKNVDENPRSFNHKIERGQGRGGMVKNWHSLRLLLNFKGKLKNNDSKNLGKG